MEYHRAGMKPAQILDRPSDFDLGQWTAQATADWLADHPGYLAGFEEQWVAVVGPWIVAHAPRFGEAADLSRAKGIERPLMVPVPSADEQIFDG